MKVFIISSGANPHIMAKFQTDQLSGGGENQRSLLAIGWQISTGQLEQY